MLLPSPRLRTGDERDLVHATHLADRTALAEEAEIRQTVSKSETIDLEAVRVFLSVAELSSFTKAAEQLGLSKSRASLRVRALEDELGSHLFQRTTRAVRLTPDGEQLLARARHLVADADEISAMFQAPSTLRGRVRVELPITMGREAIIPRLPDFLAAHPHLEVLVGTSDRRVDVVREGFDCVLRIGALDDSRLVARRLGTLAMANYAGDAYVRKHGVPVTLADLDRHYLVHYSGSLDGEPVFEHREGTHWRLRPMRALVTVNSADAYEAACRAGLGIIQAPKWRRRTEGLVEILPEHTCKPMPVSLLHPHGANVPKRVRAVLTWLEHVVAELL